MVGLQQRYADGLARLGADFAIVDGEEQDRRLAADPPFQRLLYEHACEGTYGDPAYGGNRERVGWTSVAFLGDVQPRGWTDDEVITGD